MTISTANRNDYTGNGTTATYSYTWKVFAATAMQVVVRSTALVDTVLAYPTHYTATGVGRAAGGTVVLVNGAFDWIDASGFLKSGYRLAIVRGPALSQLTDVRNSGDFFPEVHEDTFDYITMLIQRLQNDLIRCIKIPETYGDGTTNTLLGSPTASTYVGFNASNELGLYTGLTVGALTVSAFIQTLLEDATAAAACATLDAMYQSGAVAFKGDISPTALSANQDNYNPTGLADASVLRLSVSGSADLWQITGLAGGADGRLMTVHNVSAGNSTAIVLKNESSSSTAANRFISDAINGGGVVLEKDDSCVLAYDPVASRWRVIAASNTNNEWLSYWDTPTYISATSFSVPGNASAHFEAGRRIKTKNAGAAEVFGVVQSVVITGVTTVTIFADPGSLDSGLYIVFLGQRVTRTSDPKQIAGYNTPITLSGTSVDKNDFPSWAKRITGSIVGMSTNGTSVIVVQIGDAGGIETSGYLCTGTDLGSGASSSNSTGSFRLSDTTAAARVVHGIFELVLHDAATNTWTFRSSMGLSDSAGMWVAAGSKPLSATLDRIRLTTSGGANTFDAGSISWMVE